MSPDIPDLRVVGLAAGPPPVVPGGHGDRYSDMSQSLPDGSYPGLARMGGKGGNARIFFPAEVLLDMFLQFYQE